MPRTRDISKPINPNTQAEALNPDLWESLCPEGPEAQILKL